MNQTSEQQPLVRSITPELAHVINPANQLVHGVWAKDEPNTYCSNLLIDGTHPYLYENPALSNHVSGTTLIDLGRQLMKAVCHLYYDIPLDFRFALAGINLRFHRFAKTNVPFEGHTTFAMHCIKPKSQFYTANVELRFVQENQEIAKGTSEFSCFPKRIEDLMMRKLGLPSPCHK